jgi:hypothetical protein
MIEVYDLVTKQLNRGSPTMRSRCWPTAPASRARMLSRPRCPTSSLRLHTHAIGVLAGRKRDKTCGLRTVIALPRTIETQMAGAVQ